MKNLGAKWLVKMFDYIKGKKDIVRNGFKESGISAAIEKIVDWATVFICAWFVFDQLFDF